MSLKGTKTEKNLLAAFAGESQARNRYTFYAKAAQKEGYHQIANIFLETAENERVHAKNFFKFLEGGMVEIQASYPAGTISKTIDNLKAAAAGEHEEWTKLYADAAKIAKEEGFNEVSSLFEQISKVEKRHEERYNKLLENINKNMVFKKDTEVEWKCLKCGYIHKGKTAPNICPACKHPQAYYEVNNINY